MGRWIRIPCNDGQSYLGCFESTIDLVARSGLQVRGDIRHAKKTDVRDSLKSCGSVRIIPSERETAVPTRSPNHNLTVRFYGSNAVRQQKCPEAQNSGADDLGKVCKQRIRTHSWALGISIVALGATLCALLIVILFSNLPLNLDCAVYLNCARELLRGGVPYVDFVDTNPPMAFYVHILPVYVSDRFALDHTIVFHLMVAALIAYSAAMVLHLLLRLYPRASIPVLLVVTGISVFFSVYIVCFGWFGEREHLFMLAYVPFLFCRQARHVGVYVGPAGAALIGAVLGPFILLKPHFCVIAIAVEGWMFFRTRRLTDLLSPEVILVLVWGIAYAASFALAPLEMKQAFWGRWLPFVARNYDVFDLPLKDFAWRGLPALPHYVPIVLACLPVCVVISRKLSFKAFLQVETLVVGTLSAYAMFLIQHKGWPYQLYPMLGFSFLLAGSMAMAVIEPASMFAKSPPTESGASRSALLAVIGSVLIVGCALVTAHRLLNRNTVRSETDPFVALIEKYSSVDERIVWISPSLNPATQTMIYTRRLPGSRYLAAYAAAMFYKDVQTPKGGPFPYRSMDQAPEDERLFLLELCSDIRRNKPRLVFIRAADSPNARGRQVSSWRTTSAIMVGKNNV